MSDQLLLALDFGGTKLSAAVTRPGERTWHALERVVSPPHKDARYEIAAMLVLAQRLLGERYPAAVGVSFGGPVDARRGLVLLSHHVPGWENTPLREQMEAHFHAPVSIDNDANIAALGEYSFGAGKDCASLLYVTVSTGVGGGWVLDGDIYHGADGMAGEIGHTVVDPRGPECICGRHGCVEIMACGPAIARDARTRLVAELASGTSLYSLVAGDLNAITAAHVAQAAQQGDELAQRVLGAAADALGFGIGTAITLMNPERVVIGGGVSKSGPHYFERVRTAARANSLAQMRVDIVPAALGDDAPLWGAIALAERMMAEGHLPALRRTQCGASVPHPSSFLSRPHRRFNPLTGDWILVSPHRTQRPWLGQVEAAPPETRPRYDPDCYLCPGNARAGRVRNPAYEHTFVFDNDYAALVPDTPPAHIDEHGILRAASERGICRVICFSPRHDWTLPDMPLPEIRRVVDVWGEQTAELAARTFINYVAVFENKGAMMGASNPHPHCQVWAEERIPTEPEKELRQTAAYWGEHGTCLLCDYLGVELAAGERIVLANEHFVALVPFWAVYPFETILLARRHVSSLNVLTEGERDALADILKRLTTRYDNLFQISFPYSMGWHQQPSDGAPRPGTHLHAHYYPPLLRSATVRKFMVGYELLANPQRDLTAETAAARLREMSEVLYRSQQSTVNGKQ